MRSADDAPLAGCDPPSATDLVRAIAEFNRGDFFECHETLEALWLAEPAPIRRLYQGILQVGVAFHHLKRHNYRGAMRLLTSGTAYLVPFAPCCQGVDVAALLVAARDCQAALAALGPARIAAFDQAMIPRIRLVAAPAPRPSPMGGAASPPPAPPPRGGGE